ncbi:MAG: KAP family NTPase, partial [Dehalococcoidia bacterium]|nr:KAP family NTPase [Dehalococcoidia bacterium]
MADLLKGIAAKVVKPKTTEDKRGYFLPDTPAHSDDEDKFGHTAHVNALVKIVASCPTPFCIGVFGRWGTGKSGIAERLCKAIDGRSKKSRQEAVLFNAWQFVGDSFRRQFLIECDERLKTKRQFKCRLARAVTRTVQGKIRLDLLGVLVYPVAVFLAYLAGLAAFRVFDT